VFYSVSDNVNWVNSKKRCTLTIQYIYIYIYIYIYTYIHIYPGNISCLPFSWSFSSFISTRLIHESLSSVFRKSSSCVPIQSFIFFFYICSRESSRTQWECFYKIILQNLPELSENVSRNWKFSRKNLVPIKIYFSRFWFRISDLIGSGMSQAFKVVHSDTTVKQYKV